jgi:thioredoxin reductase
MSELFDVGIVGGGPAGLSAALLLARSRRRVSVFDHGKPRNHAARAVHGYLGLDGIEPHDLRARARQECEGYGVEFVPGEVVRGHRQEMDRRSVFCLELANGDTHHVRKLLLATGVVDDLPRLRGIDDFYGTTIHHCPYCDGWEHRDQQLVAYGTGKSAVKLAITLLGWSKYVTCCTDGTVLPTSETERLQKYGVKYRPEKINGLNGTENTLREVCFLDGDSLPADALFFGAGQGQRSSLPKTFGCETDADGLVVTKGKQGSGVPGLFLAGDADGDVQFAIVAAAEGAIAATAINAELDQDDYP